MHKNVDFDSFFLFEIEKLFFTQCAQVNAKIKTKLFSKSFQLIAHTGARTLLRYQP